MADRRKFENIAVALPVFGAAVILPPIVGVFASPVRLFGIPLVVIYLFAIWMFFIVGTLVLSRRLESDKVADAEVSYKDQIGDG